MKIVEYIFFVYGDSSQGSVATAAHMKKLVQWLHDNNYIHTTGVIISEDTDGFSYQYICATVIYLLLLLACDFSNFIDQSFGSIGHVKSAVDRLNSADKNFWWVVRWSCI